MDWELILQYLEKIASFLILHWAFFAVSIILGMIGEVVKAFVIGGYKKEEIKGWRLAFSNTMRLHPILAGGMTGLVLGSLVPEQLATGGLIGSVLYFALSGAISSWLHDGIKDVKKNIIPLLKNFISKKLSINTEKTKQSEEIEKEE